MKRSADFQRGFTLVEVIVVIGMAAILMAVSVIALVRPQVQASVSTITDTFMADLKQQQLLSMMGDSGSQTLAQAHGVRITASSYTVFVGSAFTGSTDNFAINLPSEVTFSYSTLPLDIIFTKHSGEITPISNLIIRNTSGDQKVLTINRLGGVTVN